MKALREMFSRSMPFHDQAVRVCAPLKDHFGINHFWYYRITNEGSYTFFGTHSAWSEYCFDMCLTAQFPCLRHPSSMESGIGLMKSSDDNAYKDLLRLAWEKFQINFCINLTEKKETGIEAFGFGSRFNDPKADERLLNNLPLLRSFISHFRKSNPKLFSSLADNQVNIAEHFGTIFYERPKGIMLPDREQFLKKIGQGCFLSLTKREKEVLRFVANGFSASYIANELGLRTKTVENYLATIKDKLDCSNKSELIEKAKEAVEIR